MELDYISILNHIVAGDALTLKCVRTPHPGEFERRGDIFVHGLGYIQNGRTLLQHERGVELGLFTR